MWIYAALGAYGTLAGISTALFGFGGGFAIVPLLYHLQMAQYPNGGPDREFAMQIAVATSTAVMLITSLVASRRQMKTITNSWEGIWPLAGFMGLGAIAGTCCVPYFNGEWIHWAFVAYLAVTLLDCLLRKGFLNHTLQMKRQALSSPTSMTLGIAIGGIAAFLGVGGSVMTVPLLKRRGYSMRQATTMASPLTLPIALAATTSYLLMAAWQSPRLGSLYAGYIQIAYAFVLALGSWLGIHLALPWADRIPDKWHTRLYLVLLTWVLVSMAR